MEEISCFVSSKGMAKAFRNYHHMQLARKSFHCLEGSEAAYLMELLVNKNLKFKTVADDLKHK